MLELYGEVSADLSLSFVSALAARYTDGMLDLNGTQPAPLTGCGARFRSYANTASHADARRLAISGVTGIRPRP